MKKRVEAKVELSHTYLPKKFDRLDTLNDAYVQYNAYVQYDAYDKHEADDKYKTKEKETNTNVPKLATLML
jgi:hypothetical protein